ncbi:hypothetical protein [Rhodococcus sp. H29-C3]|uniref:hypothetical protein n=1 Tax=Rhodococcus sp. H29-C3 TaxID=3046307 RepID=UPI0024BB2885|nr:hypothetical protein [Rhodococcus sp. H29-C3]MDJ0362770.1 hypothetical protein [Rhodococcus sp. H29-C3]
MTEPAEASRALKLSRPTVYLDQWMWFALAKADHGKGDSKQTQALEAVRNAAESGVAFPLSSTTYSETLSGITDPNQRMRLARTVASLSYMRTLRAPQVLIEHQLRTAMHVQLGRPTFRPSPIDVLGHGAHWAFRGEAGGFTFSAPEAGPLIPPSTLTEINQWAEFRLFAGPRDDQIAPLRAEGYNPEAAAASMSSRVDWENDLYKALEAEGLGKPSAREMRTFLQVRELLHEHKRPLYELLHAYNMSFEGTFSGKDIKSARRKLANFSDTVPALRIAVDLKTHLFRQEKLWTTNPIRDIDALAHAVPYSDVVVPDREMISLLARSKTAESFGTTIVHLDDLPSALVPLAARAERLADDPTGWGGNTFRLDPPPGVTF